MSSETERNGTARRPVWNYTGQNLPIDLSTLEMMESCRNVMEDVRSELRSLNALLRCHNFLSIPPSLRKIARNTEKKVRVKKVTPA